MNTVAKWTVKIILGTLAWVVFGMTFLLFSNVVFGATAETQAEAAYAETIPDEDNPYREIIMSASEEELRELEQVLCLEAGTDTWEGRVSTLQVILNRVISPKFPNTIHEVLSQRNPTQYSTYRIRNRAKVSERESDAIEHLCDGGQWYIGLDRLYQDCKPIGKNPIKVGKQYFGQ